MLRPSSYVALLPFRTPGVHNTLWVFFRKVVIQNKRDTVTFHTTSVINLGPLIEFGAEEERRMNYLDLDTYMGLMLDCLEAGVCATGT